MRLDDFTDQAHEAFNDAQLIMHELRHTELDVEHLLLALLRQPTGLTQRVLEQLNVDAADVTRLMLREVKRGAWWSSWSPYYATTQIYLTKRMQRMLHTATREAALWGDVSVGIEHLLLAIVAERKGVAARVLQNVGVTQERLVGITRAGSNE